MDGDWVVLRAAEANNRAPASAALAAREVAALSLDPLPLFDATRPRAAEALRVGLCEYLRYNKLLQALHLLHLPHA